MPEVTVNHFAAVIPTRSLLFLAAAMRSGMGNVADVLVSGRAVLQLVL